MRLRMSARLFDTARIAMSSELAAIWNFDSMRKPSEGPPMPIMIFRRDCAQKSMTHPVSTLRGSMLSRRRCLVASIASS